MRVGQLLLVLQAEVHTCSAFCAAGSGGKWMHSAIIRVRLGVGCAPGFIAWSAERPTTAAQVSWQADRSCGAAAGECVLEGRLWHHSSKPNAGGEPLLLLTNQARGWATAAADHS
jgi:hypothetical protein